MVYVKKIVLIAFVTLFLISCGKKNDNVSSSEQVPYSENEVNTNETKYKDEIEQNKTWVFNGVDGETYTNVNGDNYTKEIPVTDKGATLTYNNLHLVSGHSYKLSFGIYANNQATIDVSIRTINDDILVNKVIIVDQNYVDESLEFVCSHGEDYNYKIVFSFPGGQYYHVYLNNVLIKDLNNEDYSIKTNHLGYTLNQVKQAVFPGNMGDFFYVVNSKTNEIVYRGIIGNAKQEIDTGEYNSKGYFTSVKQEGYYYLISEDGHESVPFYIGGGIYNDVLKDSLNFFYIQRCGSDLSFEKAGDLVHASCHTSDAEVVGIGNKLNVTGGWHDAGDYGRYVKTGTEALANLLVAYYANKDVFKNNNLDILDECKYELDWLLKLQKDDGAIYNKVTTKVFADTVMPEDDNKELYVLQAATSSTASAAGVFALGSIVFEDIDEEYSDKLEEAAIKSIGFIDGQPNNVYFTNPDGFSTGDYPVTDDKVYRSFGYSMCYVLTHKKDYLNKALEYGNGLSFSDNGENTLKYLGYYVMLKDDHMSGSKYDTCLQELIDIRVNALAKIHEKNYPFVLTEYVMGSNKVLLDKINICFLVDDLEPNEINRGTGEVALSYIFGNNILNRTFVTGYGLNYPHNIHHRELSVLNTEVSGLLAPGPTGYLSEGNASKYFTENDPVARRYVDEYDAYYCNEAAILYNAPLVLALSFMSK